MQAIKLLSELVEVAVVTELTGSMESKESKFNQNHTPLLEYELVVTELTGLQNPPKKDFFFLKEIVLEHQVLFSVVFWC